MKTIKGDLILTEDTVFKESIKVEGNIKGWYNLKVIGDIDARDIDAWDINCQNIICRNIDARDIICEKRIKKEKSAKTFSRVFIQDKSKLERKEQ